MGLGQRFQFIPFWKVTDWGFLFGKYRQAFHLNLGCDEWHNKSYFLIIPLIGNFIYFSKKGFDRSGEIHIYAMFSGQFEGRIVKDCSICQEILQEVASGVRGNEYLQN